MTKELTQLLIALCMHRAETSCASSAFTQHSGTTDRAAERKARAAEAAQRRRQLQAEAEAKLAGTLSSTRNQRLIEERQSAKQEEELRFRCALSTLDSLMLGVV